MNETNATSTLRPVGEANFEQEVLYSDGRVLVAFWASWSKPCEVMTPVLAEVAAACADRVEVVAVNADDNPTLSLCLGVQHIPSLFLFERGRLRGSLVGTASKEAILDLLTSNLAGGRENVTNGKGDAK